ncbi:Scr1 family TA system antitoxin-like transcriptional regulator [Nocardiopsis lambiniae]|uniref:Scr1 family TA system antitoxin-like transcriptional regulator n=1 Tax=Nocardiopsis lambiniae TaxID=3075539 RepID=A0ABU2M6Y9_9ACTN|nr:Scr1 family TA system antitoxin-like transcriptional regulator [Nocardiopsis sp. DSM 44743]MDT0328411.1 Scr1 family TA system antitoxin-like transcriptional regulator [Nocardiopsis sp. DSM 44743]
MPAARRVRLRGVHAGVDGHFTLLEFDDSEVRQHVYVESPAGNIFFIQKRRTVAEFRERFDRLQMEPLSPQESLTLIEKAAEEHER